MFVTKAFSRDPARTVAVFGCASGMPLNRLGKSKVSNSTDNFFFFFISSLFCYIFLASSYLFLYHPFKNNHPFKRFFVNFLNYLNNKIFRKYLVDPSIEPLSKNVIKYKFLKELHVSCSMRSNTNGDIFNRRIFSRTRRVVKSHV